jgi:hypothetical protein
MKQLKNLSLLVMLLPLIACRQATEQTYLRVNNQQKNLDSLLKTHFQKMQKDSSIVLKLATITTFNWDTLHIYTSYFPEDSLKKSFPIYPIDFNEVRYNDNYVLFVFTQNNTIQQYNIFYADVTVCTDLLNQMQRRTPKIHSQECLFYIQLQHNVPYLKLFTNKSMQQ